MKQESTMHLAGYTAMINLCIFLFSKFGQWLLQMEPIVKTLTTYGSFIVFVVATSVQLIRWYRKWRRKKLPSIQNN